MDRVVFTGDILHNKWNFFVKLAHIPRDEQLNLSNGWLKQFKHHHGLYELKWHGEAGSVDTAIVVQKQKHIQDLIRMLSYQPRDIYNMDEKGIKLGIGNKTKVLVDQDQRQVHQIESGD